VRCALKILHGATQNVGLPLLFQGKWMQNGYMVRSRLASFCVELFLRFTGFHRPRTRVCFV
jgi:hypothetical protein